MVKHGRYFYDCENVISRLIGSDNVLFRIEISHAQDKVTAVFVYKFDCSQRVWENVENIKDKVFFISSNDSAFACQTSNSEIEGGRIYIALENCNYFYIYNIEEKIIVTSLPFSNLPENLCYPRWFMPDTGMTDTLKEEEIGKSHHIREKESICDAVYLKDAGNKIHTKYALPLDVVEVIAKHINDVLAYLQFRASNKLFRLAAPRVQWRSSSSMSMSRFDDLSMCPLFVFSKNDKVFTFVHPKHGLDYKNIINFPQGEQWHLNSKICCSKDGWLFLVAVNTSFQVFFNPFTKEVLPFPFRNKQIWNIRCFGMSDSPTSYECVTVKLVKGSSIVKPIITAYINFWEEGYRHFTLEAWKFPHYNTNPVFHNGLFYFLSKIGKLAIMEVTRENIRWKVLEELQAPCSTCFNHFLTECDDNLLAVFESPFAKGVQVFKLNEDTMTWMKVESLKNHMLFVGKTSFRKAAESWNGEGSFLYTSSSAPYDCNDNGLCNEDTPVVPIGRSPRTDVLLKAENIVLEFGGSVVRLSGLYKEGKGAHAYYLEKGIVESRPDHVLNLIHYEDAASLSVAILKKQFRGKIFLGCDNHPLSRQELMDLVDKSGKFSKKFEKFTGTNDPLGKRLNNSRTHEEVGWEPKYTSFAHFLETL